MSDPAWMIGIDWHCTICGEPIGCKCWVRLWCSKCGAKTDVERFPEAGDLDEIETLCPKCGTPPDP